MGTVTVPILTNGLNAMLREAILYEKLKDERVRCNICQRRCLLLPGKRGYCETRLNKDGLLYTLIYGQVSTMAVAEIERKPLFHFYPGSHALSFGSLGCNFRCPGCQNWEIAHASIDLKARGTRYVSPEKAVKLAKEYNCEGLSWTYNEPTLWFEYTYDSAKLAKREGLYTNYVTNGYITPEALDLIGPYLDSFRVDVKGFTPEFYQQIAQVPDFRGILEVTIRAKRVWNMHIEIITNIIPGYSDDESQLYGIASWIHDNLGKDTPWHVTQFVPHLKLSHLPPTPVETLERAREIGKSQGLLYVYLGNVPGHPGENTYCYNCGRMLIERWGFKIEKYEVEKGRCKYCGANIAIKGEYIG